MPILFRSIFLCLFILCYHNVCVAQTPVLKQVPGLPSNEVYDLFTDSKGFLWIAHDAGISKYDGITFTNFSNPEQSSLAATNLLEDKYGRIWFVNFTGQIFYIQNGHMNLLKAYNSKAERAFPRIGLVRDKLVATTKFGIFICDVNTMKCHYERCINSPTLVGPSSLSILKDKALLYGTAGWFIYQPEKGLKLVTMQGDDGPHTNNLTLCIASYKDTSLMFRSPANVFYKLSIVNDTVKVCGHTEFNNFINTISVVRDKYWVNSITSSLNLNNPKEYIRGYDISCIALDKEGHYWYGSLQHGLLTDSIRTNIGPKKNRVLTAPKGDLVKCMVKDGKNVVLGTQNGKLISYNTVTNKATLLMSLPTGHGGINYLKSLKDGNILIGSPVYTYIFEVKNHHLKSFDVVTSLKQADETNDALLLASSNSTMVLLKKNDQRILSKLKKEFAGLVYKGKDRTDVINSPELLYFTKRSRAIRYSPLSQTIWVSVKDGLYTINKSGIIPYFSKGSPVYASCLTSNVNKVIVGTFNNGVMIIDGGVKKKLTTDDGLLSNSIINVNVKNDNLWVYTTGAVQIFNLNTLKLIYKYPFPSLNNVSLIDADELAGECYFIAADGLYKLSPVHKETDSIQIYLNSLFINRKDTSVVNNLSLPHSSNDIQITLGTPYLFNSKDIVIRYSLGTENTARWIYTRRNERNFHFASLAPGNYSFKAQAIKLQTGLSSKPFIINFTIRPPWWQTWWFRLIIVLTALIVIVTILRIYFLNKLRQQQMEFEKKLIVEKERQHISREIHDNIGQALSVIKLNLDMSSPSEVSDVKELIGEVIQDVRQFTHGLYYGKLLTDSLFDTIKKDIDRLNNSKQLKASLDIKSAKSTMNEQSELLIYRIFQEAINNVLKHAGAKNVNVQIRSTKRQFKLIITDDGIGFTPRTAGKGLGLDSMYKRAELLKGQLTISGKPGEGCQVELVIDRTLP